MSDDFDELFKRIERRIKRIEEELAREFEEMHRMFERLAEPRRSEEIWRPGVYGESLEPLYTIRDLGDRIVVHIDLPYAAEGTLDVKFVGNVMYISARLKSRVRMEQFSTMYRGVEVSEYRTAITLPFAPQPDKVRVRTKKGVVEVVIYK